MIISKGIKYYIIYRNASSMAQVHIYVDECKQMLLNDMRFYKSPYDVTFTCVPSIGWYTGTGV